MSNKNKLLHNFRGFSFLELLIVIAIIAILATIMIPIASKFKNNSKLAGVNTNIRTVYGVLQNIVGEYNTKSGLASALTASLGDSVSNPLNDSTEVLTCTKIGDLTSSCSVMIYYTSGYDTKSSSDNYFSVEGINQYKSTNLCGAVVLVCYGNENSLNGFGLYGYDERGIPMTSASASASAGKSYFIEKPYSLVEVSRGYWNLSQIEFDKDNYLYVSNTEGGSNNHVYKIDPSNPVNCSNASTIVKDNVFSRDGPRGIAIDTSKNVFVANAGIPSIIKVDSSGNASTLIGSLTDGPWGVAVNSSGDICFGGCGNNKSYYYKKSSEGSPTCVIFSDYIRDIGCDADNNFYIVGNSYVYKVASDFSEATKITTESLSSRCIAFDENGGKYLANYNATKGDLVYKINADGTLTKFVEVSKSNVGCISICFDNNNILYIALKESDTCVIYKWIN